MLQKKINNPAVKDGVCCFGKVFVLRPKVFGFNTFLTAIKGGELNPSARINHRFFLPVLCLLAGVILSIFFGCATASFKTTIYEPGIYEGSGRGFRGNILVKILVSVSGIEDIEILDHREDQNIGGAAMEELLEQVLEFDLSTDEIDLDAVSGATASRRGFLDALENALSKAKKSTTTP